MSLNSYFSPKGDGARQSLESDDLKILLFPVSFSPELVFYKTPCLENPLAIMVFDATDDIFPLLVASKMSAPNFALTPPFISSRRSSTRKPRIYLQIQSTSSGQTS